MLDETTASLGGDQTILLAVHHQQGGGDARGQQGHLLADDQQCLTDACRHPAAIHQRVSLVVGHHLRIAGHRVGVDGFDRQVGKQRPDGLADDRLGLRHSGMRGDRRAGQDHQVVVVGVLHPVGEHDAPAHAVAEDDHLAVGVLLASDLHQFAEVRDELVHVADPHPLAPGPPMAPVVQRVGGQPGRPEALRDVVITAGMLAVTVRQDDHGPCFTLRTPNVVDDRDAAVSGERPLNAFCHQASVATVRIRSAQRLAGTDRPIGQLGCGGS